MKGTEKQIKWATDIKAKFLSDGQQFLIKTQAASNEQLRGKKAETIQLLEDLIAQGEAENDAAIWINRYESKGFILTMREEAKNRGIV